MIVSKTCHLGPSLIAIATAGKGRHMNRAPVGPDIVLRRHLSALRMALSVALEARDWGVVVAVIEMLTERLDSLEG
jgi:hypothetical protein